MKRVCELRFTRLYTVFIIKEYKRSLRNIFLPIVTSGIAVPDFKLRLGHFRKSVNSDVRIRLTSSDV